MRQKFVAAAVAGLALAGCSTQPTATQSSIPRYTWGSQAPQVGAPATPVPREVTLAHMQACPEPAASSAGASDLPDLELECFGTGRKLALSSLGRGKPMVITVWAQWCTPCETETPFLVRAHDHLGDQVSFIGINFQDRDDKALEFARKYGINWPQLVDPKGVSRGPLRLPGIPTTILADAQGRIVARHASPFVSAGEAETLIADKLGVRA